MMYTEYFYLEQWYRWLTSALPIILIGLVLVVLALCCCAGVWGLSGKEEEE